MNRQLFKRACQDKDEIGGTMTTFDVGNRVRYSLKFLDRQLGCCYSEFQELQSQQGEVVAIRGFRGKGIILAIQWDLGEVDLELPEDIEVIR